MDETNERQEILEEEMKEREILAVIVTWISEAIQVLKTGIPEVEGHHFLKTKTSGVVNIAT